VDIGWAEAGRRAEDLGEAIGEALSKLVALAAGTVFRCVLLPAIWRIAPPALWIDSRHIHLLPSGCWRERSAVKAAFEAGEIRPVFVFEPGRAHIKLIRASVTRELSGL
jgi:hypothetical protein